MDIKKQVDGWLDTWAPSCGAPRSVFEGQFRATLKEIFDEIDRRAEDRMTKPPFKLEGMHHISIKEVRKILDV